jgi:hypothetical protein
MPKIVIIPLGIYMSNQEFKTRAEFKKLGVGYLQQIWHSLPLLEKVRGPSLPTLINQYRSVD